MHGVAQFQPLANMRYSARDHFLHAVLPAFEKFSSHYMNREIGLRRDTKYAADVAGSLRDLSDHIFHDLNDSSIDDGYKTSKAYRESFWSVSREYQIICNFADIWKHREISRSDRLLSSVDDIIEYIILIRYTDKAGYYYGSRKLLSVRLADSTEQDLGSLLGNSLRLMSNELLRRGLITKIPIFPKLPSYFHSRQDTDSQQPMRVLAYTKEHFELPQLCLIFDEVSGFPRLLKRDDHFNYPYDLVFEIIPSPIQG